MLCSAIAMAASQRLSRGFHRLALFLAAIPLIVGALWSIIWSLDEANSASSRHQQVLCAHGRIAALIGSHEVKPDRWPPPSGPKLTIEGLGTIPVGEDFLRLSQDERTKKVDEILASVKAETTGPWDQWVPSEKLSPLALGCGEKYDADISYGEALIPPVFNWLGTLTSAMTPLIGTTLAATLAIYALVRAIGWVIGGFAAS